MKSPARCGCGEFQLVVSRPPAVQLVCHCNKCRAFIRKDDCHIVIQTSIETLVGGTGEEKLHHSCNTCGDPVYLQLKAVNDAVAIFADRLSPFEFETEVHTWTGQKQAALIYRRKYHNRMAGKSRTPSQYSRCQHGQLAMGRSSYTHP
jgi:hypothetical protein